MANGTGREHGRFAAGHGRPMHLQRGAQWGQWEMQSQVCCTQVRGFSVEEFLL